MRNLLKFLTIALLFFGLNVHGQWIITNTIKNGFLTTDLNGNSHSITNASNVVAQFFIGNGSQLSGISGGGNGSVAAGTNIVTQTNTGIITVNVPTNSFDYNGAASNAQSAALAFAGVLSTNSTNYAVAQALAAQVAAIAQSGVLSTNSTNYTLGATNIAYLASSNIVLNASNAVFNSLTTSLATQGTTITNYIPSQTNGVFLASSNLVQVASNVIYTALALQGTTTTNWAKGLFVTNNSSIPTTLGSLTLTNGESATGGGTTNGTGALGFFGNGLNVTNLNGTNIVNNIQTNQVTNALTQLGVYPVGLVSATNVGSVSAGTNTVITLSINGTQTNYSVSVGSQVITNGNVGTVSLQGGILKLTDNSTGAAFIYGASTVSMVTNYLESTTGGWSTASGFTAGAISGTTGNFASTLTGQNVVSTGQFQGSGAGLTSVPASALPNALQVINTNNGNALTNINSTNLVSNVSSNNITNALVGLGVFPPAGISTFNSIQFNSGAGVTNLQPNQSFSTVLTTTSTTSADFIGNGIGLTNIPIGALPNFVVTNNESNAITLGTLTFTNGASVTGGGITNGNGTLGFYGNGANVTNVNAGNLSSGTVPYPQLPSGVVTNNDANPRTNNATLVVTNNNNNTPNFYILANNNNFAEGEIQNQSSGTSASSDWVATMNAPFGTESQYYVDMGINGSGWTGTSWGIAGDAYLYIQGTNNNNSGAVFNGNLWLGTSGTNSVVNVSVASGGTNITVQINSNGIPATNIYGLIYTTNIFLTNVLGSSGTAGATVGTILQATNAGGFVTLTYSNYLNTNLLDGSPAVFGANLQYTASGTNLIAAPNLQTIVMTNSATNASANPIWVTATNNGMLYTNTAVIINYTALNGRGITNLGGPFNYPTPQLGFTNGVNIGAGLNTNTLITNTFNCRITVELTITNTSALDVFAAYRFQSNGTPRGPKYANLGSTASTNSMDFNLGPWEWFACSNLAGNANIFTNSVQQW